MLPEEVARYDEHWLDVAEKISNEALDNQIDFIKNGGITKPGGGAFVWQDNGGISVSYAEDGLIRICSAGDM